MAETASQVEQNGAKVPRWLDVLLAAWMVVGTAAFVVEIFIDIEMVSAALEPVVIVGKYAYAAMVAGCVVGSGLALVRGFVGS